MGHQGSNWFYAQTLTCQNIGMLVFWPLSGGLPCKFCSQHPCFYYQFGGRAIRDRNNGRRVGAGAGRIQPSRRAASSVGDACSAVSCHHLKDTPERVVTGAGRLTRRAMPTRGARAGPA
jgi:hypothetical protein